MHQEQANPELIIEVIEIEEFVKASKPIPKGKKYAIRIDREKYIWHNETITGEQILQLAGKNPARFMVVQRFRGGRTEKIALDQSVDLTSHGVERFSTLPLDQTEGAS